MAIETELQKATGLKPKAREKHMDYVGRLVTAAANDLSDDAWDELSQATQKWVNDNAKAYKDGKDLKDFPDAKADDDGDADEVGDKPAKKTKAAAKANGKDEAPAKKGKAAKSDDDAEDDDKPARKKKAAKDEADEDADDEKPAKRGRAKKDEDADDDKPAKKSKAAAPVKKGEGVKNRIKKILLKKPDMSAGDLYDKLKEDDGDAPSRMTVNGIRAEFRHTLRLLKDQGYRDAKGNEINI